MKKCKKEGDSFWAYQTTGFEKQGLTQLSRRLGLERSALLDYLMAKYGNEDWHAVQDAASNLRDIDAKLSVIEKVL